MTKDKPVYDRRMRTRISTNLPGRYLLADGREAKCTVLDVSLHGLAIQATQRGEVGEPVIVYVDRIGRVQGKVVRLTDDGFTIALTVTTRATERFAKRLAQLKANSTLVMKRSGQIEGHAERRDTRAVGLTRFAICDVIDLSLDGALVKMQGEIPLVGELVQLGEVPGKVVGRLPAGIAIEFLDVPDQAAVKDGLTEINLAS